MQLIQIGADILQIGTFLVITIWDNPCFCKLAQPLLLQIGVELLDIGAVTTTVATIYKNAKTLKVNSFF